HPTSSGKTLVTPRFSGTRASAATAGPIPDNQTGPSTGTAGKPVTGNPTAGKPVTGNPTAGKPTAGRVTEPPSRTTSGRKPPGGTSPSATTPSVITQAGTTRTWTAPRAWTRHCRTSSPRNHRGRAPSQALAGQAGQARPTRGTPRPRVRLPVPRPRAPVPRGVPATSRRAA